LELKHTQKGLSMQRVSRFLTKHWKKALAILLLVTGLVLFQLLGWERYLEFSYVREHRKILLNYVDSHYWPSVALFIALYISTAFFVPGAIVMTLAGGFLFGVVPATLYINVGATLGAVTAMLLSRHLIGDRIQKKFADQLQPLNRALERHGISFLLVVRIIPVLPFFTVNYLAGLTRIPLKTFVWTTSLSIVPGSLIYAFAGRQLGSIDSPAEIFSPEIIFSLLLLGLFSLSPSLIKFLKRTRKGKS